MNAIFHPGMSSDKWGMKPYSYQLQNIASELNRAKQWIKEKNPENMRHSLERALELFDLTVSANQGKKPMRDLLRLREGFSAYYVGTATESAGFVNHLRNFLDLDPEVRALGLSAE